MPNGVSLFLPRRISFTLYFHFQGLGRIGGTKGTEEKQTSCYSANFGSVLVLTLVEPKPLVLLIGFISLFSYRSLLVFNSTVHRRVDIVIRLNTALGKMPIFKTLVALRSITAPPSSSAHIAAGSHILWPRWQTQLTELRRRLRPWSHSTFVRQHSTPVGALNQHHVEHHSLKSW